VATYRQSAGRAGCGRSADGARAYRRAAVVERNCSRRTAGDSSREGHRPSIGRRRARSDDAQRGRGLAVCICRHQSEAGSQPCE
jgi:hypothetical protein